MSERTEIFVRLFIWIVCGIILGIWEFVAWILAVVHWFYVLILGKRHSEMANFANGYVSYMYSVYQYLYFTTNKRPWPFGGELKKRDKVEI